ncbi:hypothetical protein [Bradyrhizobium sp. 195]|uniref:hypothetical protein n=1 Tax=Bradyrhizobium sp. 195 TaxID=2782662 RepID=UPI0020014A11|nr:hypothetical protein [Bradyrhizobium sp. 195]UPK27174.1 hypothetical protein IVB26_00710 [Bradyrhizobium sp. 195]
MNVLAVALVSYALLSPAGGQVQPAPRPEVVRPAVKKPAAAPRAPAEAGPCQIGVIPIAGDLFMVEKFGPVKFLDKYTRTSVAAWALDDLVVSRVRAAAAGIAVRRIPYTPKELRSGGRQEQTSLFRPYREAAVVGSFVQFLAPRLRCERYLVVHRHGGTQREYGIGISQYPYGGPVHLFAMMFIRIYDGRTFEVIKEAPALMTEDTYLERMRANFLGGPSTQLDRAMFPEKPADVVNNPVLREGVRTMLTKSLDKTLPALLQRPAQIQPR